MSPRLQRVAGLVLCALRYLLSPFVGTAGIDEVEAKFYAFGCFRNPNAWTKRVHCQLQEWPSCAKAARAHDPYASIWLLEGLATRLFDSHIRHNLKFPWLTDSRAQEDVISSFLLVLHTGAGMSLAGFTLSKCSAGAPMPSVSAAIEEFLALANEQALPTYRHCMVEPLGLVVRTLYPQWTSLISGLLSATSHEDCALFWHGSGRGLYFSPLQVIPSRRFRHWDLDRAASDAPTDRLRMNLISGFFWAMTLVNIRHPEVVAHFLGGRPVEHWSPDTVAISDGVSAALLVWHHLTGDNTVTDHFLGNVPSRAHEGLRRLWDDQIVSFSRRRLTHGYEPLRHNARIGDVFQFQGP